MGKGKIKTRDRYPVKRKVYGQKVESKEKVSGRAKLLPNYILTKI